MGNHRISRMKNNIPFGIEGNIATKLMGARLGNLGKPEFYKDTVDMANEMATGLHIRGGFP